MINIAELLKDVPKGMKLYSPLFGEVNFVGIDKQSDYPINVTDCKGNRKSFTEFGVYFADHPDAECLLFSSKDCRTWEEWKINIYQFKVLDWLVHNNGSSDVPVQIYGFKKDRYLVTNILGSKGELMINKQDEWRLWTIAYAKNGDVTTNGKLIVIFNKLEEPAYKQHIIAYVGLDLFGRLQITEDTWHLGIDKAMPATKEQRSLLFQKMKEAGYEWDAEKKELRKIKPHYDISNFHAGMPVLVRETSLNAWEYVLFSHCYIGSDGLTRFNAGLVGFTQCIPFNKDTEHLLGTTNMPDEYYVNW